MWIQQVLTVLVSFPISSLQWKPYNPVSFKVANNAIQIEKKESNQARKQASTKNRLGCLIGTVSTIQDKFAYKDNIFSI